MTQSDTPHEGREEIAAERNAFIERGIKLRENQSLIDTLNILYRENIESLRDQLSKERREKEKLKELHIHQETHLNDQLSKERESKKQMAIDLYDDLYKEREEKLATKLLLATLEESLTKEREMRKELMPILDKVLHHYYFGGSQKKTIEDLKLLIAKASELDRT